MKFSVRLDRSYSIHVSWTDGPTDARVSPIVNEYSFSDFDGMIDLKHNSENWLHPDGSMSLASDPGTQGSMGLNPAIHTDCPEPGAVQVRSIVDFALTQRNLTRDHRYRWAKIAAKKYGIDWDGETEPHQVWSSDHRLHLDTLAYRCETECEASMSAS